MRLGHIVVESVMFHSCSHCANFYMIFHFCGSFHGFQGLLARRLLQPKPGESA